MHGCDCRLPLGMAREHWIRFCTHQSQEVKFLSLGKVSIPGLRQRCDRKEREGKTFCPFWLAHQEGVRPGFSMNPKQGSVLLLEAGNTVGSRAASDHPNSGDEQWKRHSQSARLILTKGDHDAGSGLLLP